MRRQIYNFVKEPALKYLALTDIEVLISKEQGDPTTTDEQKKALDFSFIQSVTICICLQKTTGKFASERVVKPLFEAAQLNKILQLSELGGYADWTSEMLYMILDDNDQLVPIWSVMTPREINQQILDWLRDMKADADGIPKADWENYLYKGDRKLTRKNADQVTLTQQKKRQKKGMADLDESGQGVKESYQRKVELLRKPEWAALTHEDAICKMLDPNEGQAGQQGGELLACFIVLVRDEFRPIGRFGGPIGFLEKNLVHYKATDFAGTTSEATKLLQHAITFANKLIPALSDAARMRRPMFGSGPAQGQRSPMFEQPEQHREYEDDEEVCPPRMPSALYTSALPARGGAVANTPASRRQIRSAAMHLMQRTNAAVGFQQARMETSSLTLLDVRSDKTKGIRGRMLSGDQLQAGLQHVTAQLRTSKLRTDFHSNDSVLVDDDADEASGDEGGAGGVGAVGRFGGGRRVVVPTDGVALPAGGGWSRNAPRPIKVGQLVATLHMGPRGQAEWYDAIVLVVQQRKYNHGTQEVLHLFFPEDDHDDWYTLPDASVAFDHGHKATSAQLKEAKKCLAQP